MYILYIHLYNKLNLITMEDTKELLEKLLSEIDLISNKLSLLDSTMKSEFTGVNKRLDGIDYELKKLNTVTRHKEQYNNIPA